MATNFFNSLQFPTSAAKTMENPFVQAEIPFNERVSTSIAERTTVPKFVTALQDSTNGNSDTPRTPEQQQALLAQMRERGEAIGSRLAGEQRQNYYATRQGMEQRRAQEALTPSPYEGGTPGRDRRMAGAQALVAAERWRQVAEGTRGAMERAPVSAFGGEFRQGSMGQFSPVQRPSYTTRGLAGGYAPAPITPPSVPSAQDSFASSFATGRAPSIFEDNQPQNSLYLTGSPFIPFRS